MELNQIDIRENYFNDIHQMKPNWWMHWGMFSILLILIIFLILSLVVNYPDVIKSDFRIKTNNPSVTVPILNNAQIEDVLINNHEKVEKDSYMIVLKNNSNHNDVLFLKNKIRKLELDDKSLIDFFENSIKYDLQLEDSIEKEWISLSNELLEYYKVKKINSLQNQISYLKEELSKQLKLNKAYKDLVKTDRKQILLLNESYYADSILFSKKVISKLNFSKRKEAFLSNTKALKQNSIIVQKTNLAILKIENSIKELYSNEKAQVLQQKLNIKIAINRLSTSIKKWENDFVLISPICGEISFIQDIKKGSFYEGNIIVIIPETKSYYATINIPRAGSGKVKIGQSVILKLNDYPYKEYGIVTGKLIDKSSVAGEEFYLGKVEIIESVKGISHNGIIFEENMMGIGNIITKERSVFDRVFSAFSYHQ